MFAGLTQTLTQMKLVFAHFRSPSSGRENHCLSAHSETQRKPAKVPNLTGGQVVAGSNPVSPRNVSPRNCV